MIVETESGSLYEIADDKKKVRRLNNGLGSSLRAGYDGIWKDCDYVCESILGESLLIVWRVADCVLETTVTSPIVTIEE